MVTTPRMSPIRCKRPPPPHLHPKAIGESHVFNFFGPAGLLAVLSVQGRVYLAHETANGIALRSRDGKTKE